VSEPSTPGRLTRRSLLARASGAAVAAGTMGALAGCENMLADRP
jgi:hypothetical protein